MIVCDPVAKMLDIIAQWKAPWEAPFVERAMACAIAYENGEPHESFHHIAIEHFYAREKRVKMPRYFAREGIRQ